MPHYQRVGDVPPKRHTQFRSPQGDLYAEELMGSEGFSSSSSLLYHRRPPTAIVGAESVDGAAGADLRPNEPLLPRHLRTGDLPETADLVTGRDLLLANDDVRLSVARPTGPSGLYRNATGDEAVAVDQVVGGNGVVQIHYRTGTRHPVELGAGGLALQSAGDGAVFSPGELEPGVRGVAAAVVGVDGRPQASVALVAPEHRFPDDDVAAAAVTEAARRISLALARDAPAPPSPPSRPGGRDAPLPAGR